MKPYFQKHTAALLLFIFVWSCFGMGLGMIGHSVINEHSSHEMTQTMNSEHECCAVTEEGTAETQSAIDHHQMDPVIIEMVKSIVLLAVAVLFFVFTVEKIVSSSVHTYAYYWHRKISYYALYMQQLFRQGILHPKTW